MSKFIVPLSLADFIESPGDVFAPGFVGAYVRNAQMKLMKDGLERDLVLDRTLEGFTSDGFIAPVFANDTVLTAINKLQNSLSSLTLQGDVEGTVSYQEDKLVIQTTIVGEYVDKKWTHIQSTPSAQWIIDHPLEKNPAVTLLNSAKEKFEGDESYPYVGRVIVNFSEPMIGTAELN